MKQCLAFKVTWGGKAVTHMYIKQHTLLLLIDICGKLSYKPVLLILSTHTGNNQV